MDLVNSNFKISNDLIELIFRSTSGFISVTDIEKLIDLFSNEMEKKYYTQSSEANLFRIINSVFDKGTFLKDCLIYPHHIEIITSIAAYSNFLTDVVVRNPSLLYLVFNPSTLERETSQQSIDEEIETGISKFNSFDAKVNFLRRFKRQKLLIIGLNDILDNADLRSTTAQISYLAKGISSSLFTLCYNEILSRKKIKIAKNKFCLAALGKLGGNELNYSSDIDLILFYDENSLHGKSPQFTYQELLGEAAQLFTQNATEFKGEGYIYRVDFRLRPDGKYAPICMAIGDYFKYYENRGAEWERQMLIKLSFVAGNKLLFNEFQDYVKHFVFPKSFTKSPLEQISKMKTEIEKRLSDELNVKLFTGGIRDIEFTVQALQLLNAGKITDLRTGNTLEAIKILFENNLITSKESKIFTDAYIFYRKIEHFLQLMNDTQTHEIPKSGETTEKLSHYLNYSSSKEFIDILEKQRKTIRKIFKSFVNVKSDSPLDDFNLIKFTNPKTAKRNFDFLATGKSIFNSSNFDKKTVTAFESIRDNFIKYLEKSKFPDITLEHFSKIIQSSKIPYFWYSELENENIFQDVLHASEFSKKFTDLLLLKPNLVDLIITRKVYTKDLTSLFDYISKVQLDFILTFQFILNLIDEQKVSSYLTLYYDKTISKIFENQIQCEFFLAAMGSYGTNEVSFSSDLDLIIVSKNPKLNNTNEKIVVKLLRKISEELSNLEVDFKLRPEGKSSNIVWDISAYKKYLSSRARVWEFQSLLKIRLICGSENLLTEFKTILTDSVVKSNYDIQKDIYDMHKKLIQFHSSKFQNKINLKNDFGGINTISFLIDLLLLKNIHQNNELFGATTKVKIEKLISNLSEKKWLLDSFEFLKKVIFMNEIILNSTKKELAKSTEGIERLSVNLNFKTTEDLFNKLEAVLKENKQIFKVQFNNEDI